MSNNKLKKARSKIDKLDNKIFNLIKQRTQIVKYMLTLKQYKNQIIDHRRIKEILIKLKKKIFKEQCWSQNYRKNMEVNDLGICSLSKKKLQKKIVTYYEEVIFSQ